MRKNTNPHRESILALNAQGISVKEIMGRLGVTKHVAENTIYNAGLETANGKKRRERREKLLLMQEAGHRISEIASAIGISRTAVQMTLKKLGLKPNHSGAKYLKYVGNCIQCAACQQIKPPDEFYRYQCKGRWFTQTICKSCESVKYRKERERDVFRFRVNVLKCRAKRLGIPCNLTIPLVEQMFAEQNGLCFYTDRPMDISVCRKKRGPSPNSMSVDKIYPEEGYVVGNVVLCTHKANQVKSNLTMPELAAWIPGWYARLQDFVGSDFPQIRHGR
jgi:transposase